MLMSISILQSYDGGFGLIPGAESHGEFFFTVSVTQNVDGFLSC